CPSRRLSAELLAHTQRLAHHHSLRRPLQYRGRLPTRSASLAVTWHGHRPAKLEWSLFCDESLTIRPPLLTECRRSGLPRGRRQGMLGEVETSLASLRNQRQGMVASIKCESEALHKRGS